VVRKEGLGIGLSVVHKASAFAQGTWVALVDDKPEVREALADRPATLPFAQAVDAPGQTVRRRGLLGMTSPRRPQKGNGLASPLSR